MRLMDINPTTVVKYLQPPDVQNNRPKLICCCISKQKKKHVSLSLGIQSHGDTMMFGGLKKSHSKIMGLWVSSVSVIGSFGFHVLQDSVMMWNAWLRLPATAFTHWGIKLIKWQSQRPITLWLWLFHTYGKSPCSMGKSTFSMAMFNSYVPNYQRLSHFGRLTS